MLGVLISSSRQQSHPAPRTPGRCGRGLNLIGAILLIALGLLPGDALAGSRFALVIGNGNYASAGRLENPGPDARLIARSLAAVGFDVALRIDANQAEMKQAIVALGRQLRTEGRDAVGLFYFAGHGVQANGHNYLIPIDGDFRDEADLDVFAVDAGWVLGQMESAGNVTNIVVLDACRNNPFSRSFRSAARGLARIDAPTGSFIAYATAPGEVAYDGDHGNSPYSRALAGAISEAGLPIEQTFKVVRIDVFKSTDGLQTPWDSSSLVDEFYFVPPGGIEVAPAKVAPVKVAPAEVVAPGPGPSRLQLAMQGWEYFKNVDDPDALDAFAEEFSDTPFASLARARAAALRRPAEPDPAPAQQREAPPPALVPDWCPNAATDTELSICRTPVLAALDLRLSRLYAAARRSRYGAAREMLVNGQRLWLVARDRCGRDAGCIEYHYRARIADLGG